MHQKAGSHQAPPEAKDVGTATPLPPS